MKNADNQYKVILYYCYAEIKDPDQFRDEHHLMCLELDLRGRIIVSQEGLNGTVSGSTEMVDEYMNRVKADPRFADTDFKEDFHPEHTFKKLNVRHKSEIVHSSLAHINPRQKTGAYVEPAKFREMIKNEEDIVILDVRSNYEHELGRFKNAVTLDIENFRDFPEKLSDLEQYKGKKIVTYCTGGIKCEKASAYLLEQGFENVYQLHGGIIKYGIEADGEDFEGKCYVFDNRLSVDVNKVNPKVVSKCFVCESQSDRMVNCANPECNVHVAICEKCGWEMEGACSKECMEHPEKREYNGTGYYQKNTNGYDPYKGFQGKLEKNKL
ncbi:UPF0176 protein [Marivirga sericea]|uniref:tRNA uridine(34) hydroxylase n=1 Tax=Marivirga sericea TaxID=1028 RepID=A0A1X7HZ45_9BACT|nr:rhodanese-related sulfurtransferase [Marivirga sericea]SMG07280.1 UPF0176 protein [Marivirga sericea]